MIFNIDLAEQLLFLLIRHQFFSSPSEGPGRLLIHTSMPPPDCGLPRASFASLLSELGLTGLTDFLDYYFLIIPLCKTKRHHFFFV